ncbi:MAG: glycosyltransferase family 2 protein [Candidatus Atribacteria bacterium]
MKSNSTQPLVYIVILNWNGWQDTAVCVESLLKISYPNYKILIVDNGSTDDSVKMLSEKFPNVEILQTGENLGYAGGNNRGIEKALANGAEYVFVLNNDTKVDKNFLHPLVDAMEEDKQIGITSGTVYNFDPPHTIQYVGGYFNLYKGTSHAFAKNTIDRGQFNTSKEVSLPCGAAMLIRADILYKIGMINEMFFLFYEEVALSMMVKSAGYKITFTPGSKIYHKIGASGRKKYAQVSYYTIRNRIWIERMYATKLQYFVFNLYFWFYLLPRIFAGHVLNKRFHLLKVMVKAVLNGFLLNPKSP